MLLRRFGFGLLFTAAASFAIPQMACKPAKMAHEMPGPAGCGKRDPRDTSPGMLSVAQKQVLRDTGSPFDVSDNNHGGKDWMFRRNNGSVFGEKETLIVYSFNAQGLLVEQRTDVLKSLGKQ